VEATGNGGRRGSYLDELIVIAGGRNAFHDLVAPSPIVSVEEIARRNPDVIVASHATAAELRERPQWRAVRAVRDSQWIIHDPALTGRPSIVLGMAAVSLARALHPELASRLPALPAPLPGAPE
jgi:ABC-type Fe3+-hydroxamate transport system substrate-binding protein